MPYNNSEREEFEQQVSVVTQHITDQSDTFAFLNDTKLSPIQREALGTAVIASCLLKGTNTEDGELEEHYEALIESSFRLYAG